MALDAVGLPAGLSASWLRSSCGSDRLCAARKIVDAVGPPARLEQVEHPDSDSIRWARNLPSVLRVKRLGEGRGLVALGRFGRKVTREIAQAVATLAAGRQLSELVLDLRGNGGGSFQRMIKTAALFTGPMAEALELEDDGSVTRVSLASAGRPISAQRLTVLIGPKTASSGEILAGLLRRYAGAALLGEASAGKDYLYRVVPVEHDWRLLWPAQRVRIPGVRLAGGLRPDRPIGPALAAQIGPGP